MVRANYTSIEHKNKTQILNNLGTFIFLNDLEKVFDLWQKFRLFVPI